MADRSCEVAPTTPSAEALRGAFVTCGVTAETAALLMRMRAAGPDWEAASSAVADALAMRGRQSVPDQSERAAVPAGPPWRLTLVVLLLYVVLRPLMGFGHEVTVAALAWLAHAEVGTGWWTPLVAWLGLDPIYAGAAIRSLGGVDLLGLSVADPVGGVLHALLPALFQSPGQVSPGAAVSMVAAPGTPALGRGLASLGADVLWLAGGIWSFWRWRASRWALAQLGLLVQAQIAVNHLLGAPTSLRDVEASGLPFAVALALPSLAGGSWFTSALGGLPAFAQDLVVSGSLVLIGYAAAIMLLLLAHTASSAGRHIARSKQAALLPAPHAMAIRIARDDRRDCRCAGRTFANRRACVRAIELASARGAFPALGSGEPRFPVTRVVGRSSDTWAFTGQRRTRWGWWLALSGQR
jgi:hypothetical protein